LILEKQTNGLVESWVTNLRAYFSTIGVDLSHGIRQVLCRPALSLLVVLTLAICVGPNVAVFSIVKAVLINQLPYPQSDRIMQVWERDSNLVELTSRQPFSYFDFSEVRDRSSSFDTIGLYNLSNANIGGEDQPARLTCVAATAGVLETYGVPPARGRFFSREEAERQGKVVVISNRIWRNRFSESEDVLENVISVNGEDHQIIGVMPSAYEFLSPRLRGRSVDLWMPLDLPEWLRRPGNHAYLVVARLKDGTSQKAARQELAAIADQLRNSYPHSNKHTEIWLSPLRTELTWSSSGRLKMLFALVFLVLLIGCANVVGVRLAAAAPRRQEFAIRSSIGASPSLVTRHLFAESALLAAAGTTVGVALGQWSLKLIRVGIPKGLVRGSDAAIDGGVLLFALVLAVLSTLVLAVAPVILAGKTPLDLALRGTSRTLTQGNAQRRTLWALSAGQLTLAFVLSSSAVLLVKSYHEVSRTPLGFDADKVEVVNLALLGQRYKDEAAQTQFWKALVERVENLPGVNAAAVASKLPIEGGSNGWLLVEGESYDPDVKGPLIERSLVSPGYFEAMGIELLRGRIFDQDEGSDTNRFVVVNRALADHYWPGDDPVGKRLGPRSPEPTWSAEIVGVVENVRQWGVERPALPEVYYQYQGTSWRGSNLVVRSENPASLVAAIRREIRRLDPELPVVSTRTMRQVVEGSVRGRRFVLSLVELFAGLALVLAATGVFGMMANNVAARTQEIGIRLALGATRRDVSVMIFGEAMRMTVLSSVIGAGVLLVVGRMMQGSLYGLKVIDTGFLFLGLFVLLSISLGASIVPVLRAVRVDPGRVLRPD
jgi:predicted permease